MSSKESTPRQSRSLKFVVGNTYPKQRDLRKNLHRWTLYCDVVSGDPDLIDTVTVIFGDVRHVAIRTVTRCISSSGVYTWRFSVRRKTASPECAKLVIRGRGGTRKYIRHQAIFRGAGSRTGPYSFFEARSNFKLRPLPLADRKFGIELELTSSNDHSAQDVVDTVRSLTVVDVKDMTHSYSLAKASYYVWKLVSDSSIVCHRDMPDCNKFEIVSRILRGGEGLAECHRVVRAVQSVQSITINKTMGFHVHVDASSLTCQQLVRLCQNFVSFEEAIDAFMPRSRKGNDNEFCRSNKSAIIEGRMPDLNRVRHSRLASCRTKKELAQVMNPDGNRYFKLNLQNLGRGGKKNTVEFRQHSATSNAEKVNRWVRFCVAMVQNSADSRSTLLLDEGTGVDVQFHLLFEDVIKDRSLRNFYDKRREQHCGEMCSKSNVIENRSSTQLSLPRGPRQDIPPCRRPARLLADDSDVVRRVSLENRAIYFGISACPITVDAEKRMEAISREISGEAYTRQSNAGQYGCARCGCVLYSSADKFIGPCVWPSFRKPMHSINLRVIQLPTSTYNDYTCEVCELYCGGCLLFLGHRFEDGETSGDDHPGARYRHCVLSLSLNFIENIYEPI